MDRTLSLLRKQGVCLECASFSFCYLRLLAFAFQFNSCTVLIYQDVLFLGLLWVALGICVPYLPLKILDMGNK